MDWIGPLVLWIGVNAVVGYAIGKSKNNVEGCVMASIILGPIGWIVALVDEGNLRKCPFCAELVKREAIVCRYCGKDLPKAEPEPIRPESQSLPKSTKGNWIALAAFIAALVIAGIIAAKYFKHKNASGRDSDAVKIRKMVDDAARRGERWSQEPPGPGAALAISDLKLTETQDSSVQKSLALQIGIEKHPNAVVDANKVRVMVSFYDTVGDKEVRPTDAEVNYEWLSPASDWTDTNPKFLRVTYVRPNVMKQRGGQRKYLGYTIQLYYDDELQAFQADPTRLLQLFPPSKSLARRGSQP